MNELRSLRAVLSAILAKAEAADVTLLLDLDTHQWMEFICSYDRLQRIETTRVLIERAHALLSSAPKLAEPVARLAIRFAKGILLPLEAGACSNSAQEAIDLEGDGWREHAQALLTLGRFDAAKRSAQEAVFLYSLGLDHCGDGSLATLLVNAVGTGGDPARVERLAILCLIVGQVMHWQGASDDGLLLIEQASNVLLGWLDNKRKYVQGRTIYAMILAATKRHAEAASSLENTAQMARELGDVETLAHIVNNIGYCYYQTGEIQRARKCFETALELFTQLGLVADALRPRNYLATILINERKYGRAVSELYISRAAYLEAGLPNEAAYVMLKIIRALILAGRENSINWREMFDIFGDVGLRHEALLSLSKLHELAMQRSLRAADIDAAEDVISRLSVDAVPAEDVG